jgi:uncharacterized protein YqgV (UPF0045/DUF77 family)
MHNHLTNASIQLLPIVQDRHPYEWVDEVIALIEKCGLVYTVGPFGTAVEGNYEQIRQLIDDINQYLHQRHFSECFLNLQWQMRAGRDVTIHEKLEGRNRKK